MAKVRVAINGFGRIGRNVVRAIYESGRTDIDIVSVNDLGPVETNAHLLRYDSVHGRFPHEVKVDGDSISIGTHPIEVTGSGYRAPLGVDEMAIRSALDQCLLVFGHGIERTDLRVPFAGFDFDKKQEFSISRNDVHLSTLWTFEIGGQDPVSLCPQKIPGHKLTIVAQPFPAAGLAFRINQDAG